MGRSAALMLMAILAGLTCGLGDRASAQERYASVTPDSNARVYFSWGSTRKKANAASLRVCRRVSRSCAISPGSTDDMKDIFALMCCTNPRFACAVFPAGTRQKARKLVTGTFVKAHFSNCAVRGYYSARTGKRL